MGMLQSFGHKAMKSPGEDTSSPPSLMSSTHQLHPFAVNIASKQLENPTQRSSALFRQNNPLSLVSQLKKETPQH